MSSDFSADVKRLLLYVTPERKGELEALVDGVTFYEDDEDEGIGFAAVSNWKWVRVSMRCQFRLWAHCYAYYSAFATFSEKLFGQSGNRISDSDLKLAGQLLEWAVTTDVGVAKALRDGCI